VNVDNFREMKHLMFMQHLHYKSLAKKKNMKYYGVHPHIKNTDDNNDNNNNKKLVHLGTRIEAA